MFTHIVVGTDGSDTAGAAVELAVQLARQNESTLHLVRVVSTSASVGVPSGGASVADPSLGAAHRANAAEAALQELAETIHGVEVQVHTGTGAPADVIIQIADEVGADLIVVGSKGMRGTRRILGSVPNSVAHGAGCHVLIAKTA